MKNQEEIDILANIRSQIKENNRPLRISGRDMGQRVTLRGKANDIDLIIQQPLL